MSVLNVCHRDCGIGHSVVDDCIHWYCHGISREDLQLYLAWREEHPGSAFQCKSWLPLGGARLTWLCEDPLFDKFLCTAERKIFLEQKKRVKRRGFVSPTNYIPQIPVLCITRENRHSCIFTISSIPTTGAKYRISPQRSRWGQSAGKSNIRAKKCAVSVGKAGSASAPLGERYCYFLAVIALVQLEHLVPTYKLDIFYSLNILYKLKILQRLKTDSTSWGGTFMKQVRMSTTSACSTHGISKCKPELSTGQRSTEIEIFLLVRDRCR